jgi:hypothetical protein
MLDAAAPVSLTVAVVGTAPVPLPLPNPAVTVTGKKVISDFSRVVVDKPGKLAADPPKLSIHTPAVEPVSVQSTDAVKSEPDCEKVSRSVYKLQDLEKRTK